MSQTGRTRRFAPTANCYRLLLLLLCPTVGMAQNGITISNFAAAPGTGNAPDTLTFDIEWTPLTNGKLWRDTVWVFVDYNNAGTMTRLPLALNAGATLTQHSAAGQDGAELVRLEEVPGNPHGVWVVGNARTEGTFNATVRVVGAGLEPAPTDVARHVSTGMCIYAINYPPVAQYTDDGNIKLTGTPPFYLTFADGAATVSAKDAQGSYTYPPTGKQLLSLTDASRAPGSVPPCQMPAAQTLTASAQEYCAGSGVTLALSGTEVGAVYRLIKEGTESATTLTGTGSAATFTGTFTAGTYRAEIVPDDYCPRTLSNQVTVTEKAVQQHNTTGCTSSTSRAQDNEICRLYCGATFVSVWWTTGDICPCMCCK